MRILKIKLDSGTQLEINLTIWDVIPITPEVVFTSEPISMIAFDINIDESGALRGDHLVQYTSPVPSYVGTGTLEIGFFGLLNLPFATVTLNADNSFTISLDKREVRAIHTKTYMLTVVYGNGNIAYLKTVNIEIKVTFTDN